MKLNEVLLMEVPLPDDWDKAIWNDQISFKKRVAYAKQKARQLGVGSSRIAFEIPYEGRNTVLKIAKNRKGMAQNQAEVDFLDDSYIDQLGITIPMIDYDETSGTPTWIHMEKAQKIKNSDFIKFIALPGKKASITDLIRYVILQKNGSSTKKYDNLIDHESEFVQEVMDLIINYDDVIEPVDLNRAANWGLYKGRPVIIDIGLSKDVFTMHYS